jgi:uncharacterized membrane protein
VAIPLTKRPILRLPLSTLEKIIELAAGIGILAVIFILLLYRPAIPDIIPRHFNGAGNPDAWGDKGLLSALLAIPIAIYLAITLLSRFPQFYNYPFALTEENVERQYRCARMLMAALKAEIVWFFAYLEWKIIETAFGNAQGLGQGLVPALLICFTGTVAVYVFQARRLR